MIDEYESTAEPLPSAVDPETPKRHRTRAKREEIEARAFWRSVFESDVGRREMWRLLSKLHPFTFEFGRTAAGTEHERITWMHMAEQIVGQAIFLEWQARHPELVLQMQREHDPRFPKQ